MNFMKIRYWNSFFKLPTECTTSFILKQYKYVEIKCQLDATEVFVADLIASNKFYNENLCCIQLAFYFHILTTVHGQNHIKQYTCYIIILNMFRAGPCSSSGGQIVLLQPLQGRLQRVTIPEAVIIQFVHQKMSKVLLETC